MNTKKISVLIFFALLCSILSSCKNQDSQQSEQDNTMPTSVDLSESSSTELLADANPMDLFCDYAEHNFENDAQIYYKDIDYRDGESSDNNYMQVIFPAPMPNKAAVYMENYTSENEDRRFFFSSAVGEYDSAEKASESFETIVATLCNAIGNDINSSFSISNLDNRSYYYNGVDEGFICFGIQGNDKAIKMFDDDADQIASDLGYKSSEFNYTDAIGYYLKDNYIIYFYIGDFILSNTAVSDIEKYLNICEALNIKNPLSANTDYSIAHGVCDRYNVFKVFVHNLIVKAVDAEISSVLGSSSTETTTPNQNNKIIGVLYAAESNVPVYSQPDYSSAVVSNIELGVSVSVYEITDNGFARVLTSTNVSGYISCDQLSDEKPSSSSDTEITVNSVCYSSIDGLDVFSAPSLDSVVVHECNRGDVLVVVKVIDDKFAKVITSNNVQGYVLVDWLLLYDPV